MADSEPNRLIVWWEGRSVPVQILIAFPVLAVALFALNAGIFSLALLRSAAYGLFEGGVATGLLLAATASEKSRRGGPRDQQGPPG
jgi:hypothetical protein